ncbi:uncharacterized protein LOC127173424 [Labeo rohita]|uniref:uncharacterized protein LOC127173424 n=1 Tax=Labeo rohita TaxID=84645 RepID=UPI0021E2F49F|nr:uncharacterized protein LOC127173424 [Labeo rohita]
MELLIFIVFQLLMEVQSYNSLQKPIISFNGDDVQSIISCEIPLSVRADFICSLYTEDDDLLYQRDSQWSQTGKNLCMFYLNHSELFTRSVNSRQLSCVYSLKTQPEIRSPYSDTYTINATSTGKTLPTTTKTISTSTTTKHTTTTTMKTSSTVMSISESTTYSKTVDHQSKTNLPTSMTKETTPALTVKSTSGTTTHSKTASTVMSISESTTYCKTVDHQSKTNLPTSMTKETTPALTVKSTSGTTTHSKTASTVMSTFESTSYSKTGHQSKTNLSTSMTKETTLLVFTGVAVIVTGLICLCWFASKKRRKQNKTRSKKPDVNSQGIGMSCSEPAQIYSLITSVPATSQPISAGFEHPKSQQDSTADPTDTRSAITSINPIYQPSDVLVDKQQKQENEKENENVYHLYSTIPDKPVHSNADQVYSLLQMN